MRYSISDYIHNTIYTRLINCKTVIDMGGTGKMKKPGLELTNANVRHGIDATNLPFADNSFDASVSIAVLEHVGDEDNQLRFLNESVRVAKKRVLHWFPIDDSAELFLREKGHRHFSITPSLNIMSYLEKKNFQTIDYITVREHFINLTMIHPKLASKELYEYAFKNKGTCYGILMELIK